ncbi:hypothetical protein [Nostocoides jenkinsii]|uniref:Integrase catalytic domain-containing protein n=1 Tax=Nostocoides jenkinsii Ben 74 TaxID=1193518 RepID=A0A077M7Z8_9MICO|nr:hypothetical protein [Tetrasphaera jenkinsii]CCI52005.1 hypothetical protein BN13_1390004 [Tetrasphaera jenkinsii Ben 74]
MLLPLLGRVPRRLIWDNESGIGRGKRHAERVGAFTGTLATTLQRLKPYDTESKGVVERRNGFFETSFIPGREFASPADFNTQPTDWGAIANARVVRTIKARPVDVTADLTRTTSWESCPRRGRRSVASPSIPAAAAIAAAP